MKAPYSKTAFELLCEQAETSPEGVAAIYLGARVTFTELRDASAQLAGRMFEQGIQRGDRIGLLSHNRLEWLEVFFATAALGATIVPFSTWSTPTELEFLIDDSCIRWLFLIEQFGDQEFAASVSGMMADGKTPKLEKCILIDGPMQASMASYNDLRSGAPLPSLSPDQGARAVDPLMILYTSGSSNKPKAVPLNHHAAITNGFNIGERQGLARQDRVLVSIPLFWAYGAVNALPATLSHGATLVLQSHFEAGGAIDLIETEKCTAIYTLPAMTNALIAHPDFRPDRTASLRTGVTIGAPQDIIKAATELGASEICNIYGGTENYGNCCVTPHDWPLERRADCQGPPLPGVSIRICDPETGTPLGPGETGEIEVRGYLTRGYDGDSSRFNSSTFTEDGFFKTGDLGSVDGGGAMHYAGRRSEMIKRSGINVSPAEVEDTLQHHKDVGLAGVTGIEDADRGEIIVAFVVARPGHDIDETQVVAFCRERLSRYKVPDHLIVAKSLPLTVTGKLMRRDLKAMAARLGLASRSSQDAAR